MSADTRIVSLHGPTRNIETDISGIEARFKRADNDTVDSLNSVPVGTKLDNWSWRKTLWIRFVSAPTTEIADLRFYVDAPASTGDTDAWDNTNLYAGATDTYVQASVADEAGLVSTNIIPMTDVDLGRAGRELPVDVYTPLEIVPGTVLRAEDWNFIATGFQYFLVLQMKVTPNTVPGIKVARPCFYRWTEW